MAPGHRANELRILIFAVTDPFSVAVITGERRRSTHLMDHTLREKRFQVHLRLWRKVWVVNELSGELTTEGKKRQQEYFLQTDEHKKKLKAR